MGATLKVVILAGGLGTRLSEETGEKPKPMVLINDRPILWHLMNIFSGQGLNDFVIALGYRGDVIENWLTELHENVEDKHVASGTILTNSGESNWNVETLRTGLETQTGGRIRQCMEHFQDQRIIVTYGDGLANISINQLLHFHESHGKFATVTAVRPPARFGHLGLDGNVVTSFDEKNQADAGWINGGFFVLEPQVVNYIFNDLEPFEVGALPRLVADQQLMAFYHSDFWQPMDTLRDKNVLTEYAKETPPPWLKID
jgi:glucose-1-phosphate cytidylyltransferase